MSGWEKEEGVIWAAGTERKSKGIAALGWQGSLCKEVVGSTDLLGLHEFLYTVIVFILSVGMFAWCLGRQGDSAGSPRADVSGHVGARN